MTLVDRLSANPADLLTPLPGAGDDQERVNRCLALLRETLLTVEESVHRSGVTEARARLDLETLRTTMLRQSEAIDDPVGLRGARVGLQADNVPPRAGRSQFPRAGVDLDQRMAPRTFLAQTYARDTGSVSTDIAIPLSVAGRRFGALRVGLVLE